MAISVNNLLSMGVGALFASQAGISVTGNNISNVNTVGYSRQSVLLKSNTSLDFRCGQVGQGVNAEQIVRAYDKFIESSLIAQLGDAAKYDSAYYALRNIEGLFDESTVDGIGATLTAVFSSWNDLAQNSDSLAARQALISSSQTLASFIQSTDSTLAAMQKELESLIRDEVNTANRLIQEIAQLNLEIDKHTISGSNNANTLMDQRDQKVRELAEIIDITVRDNGAGDYWVTTTSGHLLVQQHVPFSLEIRDMNVENNLMPNSAYRGGRLGFSGTDTREYTVEVLADGAVDGGAQFKLSFDDGNTWLCNDGKYRTAAQVESLRNTLSPADFAAVDYRAFDANSENNSVKAGELSIWFDAGGNLTAGDQFTISPKNDIYWVTPTSAPMNISSLYNADGTANPSRITGGALGGYLLVRDQIIGEYRDRLDGLAQGIIWEVNRIHSQGANTSSMTSVLGEYQVGNPSVPLGGDTSDFAWAKYLTAGNLSFSIFDAATGESLIPYPGLEVFDFSGSAAGTVNFDPATMSLNDVADAINSATFVDANGNTQTPFTATVVDGRLQVTANSGYTFAVAADTTGLMAGLGINTFFTGTNASSIAVRGELVSDPTLVNAGSVNGAGEINQGDNAIAKAIAELLTKSVTVNSTGSLPVNQSLLDYYAGLVTRVGSDTLSMKNSATREITLAQTLSDRREEVVGVSLDEEMTALIKFQSSYKAAAKLITTADEMLQTIIGLKQ